MTLPPAVSDSASRTLRALLAAGTATRPELALTLGVTKQTVSAAIAELEGRGLAEPVAVQHGRVGRAAVRYALHGRAGWVAGIDLGTSRLRVAATRLDGAPIAERSLTNPAPTVAGTWPDGAELAARVLGGMVQDAGESAGGLLGVTVAVPRPVEVVRDLVGERLGGADALLLDALAHVAPAAVWTENDVNCAAIAQLRRGPARSEGSVLYVRADVGLGAALTVDGTVLRGARGRAGEIKALRAPGRGGTAESALGAEGLLAAAGHSRSAPLLTAIDDLFGAAAHGDPAAESAIAAEIAGLASLLGDLCALVDPGLVMVSGLIGSRAEVVARVGELCAERGLGVHVVGDPLGDRATVLGAAALAADRVLDALAPAARAGRAAQ